MKRKPYNKVNDWLKHLNAHERSMSFNSTKEVHFSTTINNWDQVSWHFREIDEALKYYQLYMDQLIGCAMDWLFFLLHDKEETILMEFCDY